MCSAPVRNVLSCIIRRHIHVNWEEGEGGRREDEGEEEGMRETDDGEEEERG